MMKIVLLLFLVSIANCAEIGTLIQGGNVANPNQFPFTVIIFSSPIFGGRTRICGGAIISRQAILTAALCVFNHNNIEVGLGVHDFSNAAEPFQVWLPISANDSRVHPLYPFDNTNDIAVLRLPSAIGFFNQAVQMIQLPPENDMFLNTQGNAVGWGCSNSVATCIPSNVLRSISIGTQESVVCNALHPWQMCAGAALSGTTCLGDEGGPFFTFRNGNFVLIGIAHNFPSLCQGLTMQFTRVTSFLGFIRENM